MKKTENGPMLKPWAVKNENRLIMKDINNTNVNILIVPTRIRWRIYLNLLMVTFMLIMAVVKVIV